jgi:integrase
LRTFRPIRQPSRPISRRLPQPRASQRSAGAWSQSRRRAKARGSRTPSQTRPYRTPSPVSCARRRARSAAWTRLRRIACAKPRSRSDRGSKGSATRAILLLAFACASRQSEIAGLDVANLRFDRRGLVVTIRRSKTDQEGVSGREYPRNRETPPGAERGPAALNLARCAARFRRLVGR